MRGARRCGAFCSWLGAVGCRGLEEGASLSRTRAPRGRTALAPAGAGREGSSTGEVSTGAGKK